MPFPVYAGNRKLSQHSSNAAETRLPHAKLITVHFPLHFSRLNMFGMVEHLQNGQNLTKPRILSGFKNLRSPVITVRIAHLGILSLYEVLSVISAAIQ